MIVGESLVGRVGQVGTRGSFLAQQVDMNSARSCQVQLVLAPFSPFEILKFRGNPATIVDVE